MASSHVSISLRDFDDAISAAYQRLFPGDSNKSRPLLEWRSRENPHGPTRYVVASRTSEIVGMIALIPTRLQSGAVELSGYQAVDTVVHPSCRGQGLFARMGALAQDAGALGSDLLWGFPNANAAPGWFGRLGWTNFGEVPLLIRPLRSSFVLGRVHPMLRALDVPLIRSHVAEPLIYEDPDRLERDWDALWQGAAAQFGTAVDRSGAWLRWRLMDKPGADYRCAGLLSEAGELRSFVATKVAEKHRARLAYGLRRTDRQLAARTAAELGRRSAR